MPKKPQDQQAKAIARIRKRFREHCHSSLDSYLSEADSNSGLPTIDVLIAYMGQGWGISVGVNCVAPESETPIEQGARESQIEIVSA
jgi:hypothetical protein